jgi:hypothetical protein
VDTWTAFQSAGPDGAWKAFLNDGLHLSPPGQELLFTLIMEAVGRHCPHLTPDRLPSHFPGHADVDAASPATTFLRPCNIGGGGSAGSAGVVTGGPGTPGGAGGPQAGAPSGTGHLLTSPLSMPRVSGPGSGGVRPVECETELLSLRGVTFDDSDGVVQLVQEGALEDVVPPLPHLTALALATGAHEDPGHGVGHGAGAGAGPHGITCGIFEKQSKEHPRVPHTHAHGHGHGHGHGYPGGLSPSQSARGLAQHHSGRGSSGSPVSLPRGTGGAVDSPVHPPPSPAVVKAAGTPVGAGDGGSGVLGESTASSASVSTGLVGMVGLTAIDVPNGSGELWVVVGPEFRGRQVATTACRAFLRAVIEVRFQKMAPRVPVCALA